MSASESPTLPEFPYEPLPSATSIRLLSLSPVSQDDYGQLEVYPLDKAPPFSALSYTWGCPFADPNYELTNVADTAVVNNQYVSDRNIPLRCNGATLFVTRNSKDAIDHIKRNFDKHGPLFGNTSHLWVDAICINQKNLNERAEQVNLMARIFSTANGAHIWLGKSLARTKRAVELIQYLSQIPSQWFKFMRQYHISKKETYQVLGLEFIPPTDWLVLRSFLQRNWFKRVWTVQEYGIPQNVTTICGGYQVPILSIFQVSNMLSETDWCLQLSHLDSFANMWSAFTALISPAAPRERTADSAERSNESSNEVHRIPIVPTYTENIAPGMQPIAIAQMKLMLWPPGGNHGGEKPELLESIQMIRGKLATDPRDKIYGLLDSINSRLEKCPEIGPIVPNYELSNPVELVYTDFAYRAIRMDGNLIVFSLINDESCRDISGLPSWVPDISRPLCPNRLINRRNWSPFPAPDHLYTAPTLRGQYSLRIRGIKVDQIADRALPFENSREAPVVSWLKLAALLDAPYHINQEPAEVLWRTLVADSDHEVCPAPSDAGKSFVFYLYSQCLMLGITKERTKALQEAIEKMISLKIVSEREAFDHTSTVSNEQVPQKERKAALDQMVSKASVFNRLIHQYIAVRRLFVTQEKRYLGLVSDSVQIGDELWVLPRANSPVVLRKLPNSHFLVIGAAYVHGIMKGEATAGRLGELGELILD